MKARVQKRRKVGFLLIATMTFLVTTAISFSLFHRHQYTPDEPEIVFSLKVPLYTHVRAYNWLNTKLRKTRSDDYIASSQYMRIGLYDNGTRTKVLAKGTIGTGIEPIGSPYLPYLFLSRNELAVIDYSAPGEKWLTHKRHFSYLPKSVNVVSLEENVLSWMPEDPLDLYSSGGMLDNPQLRFNAIYAGKQRRSGPSNYRLLITDLEDRNSNLLDTRVLTNYLHQFYRIKALSGCDNKLFVLLVKNRILPGIVRHLKVPENILLVYDIRGELLKDIRLASYTNSYIPQAQDLFRSKSLQSGTHLVEFRTLRVIRPEYESHKALFESCFDIGKIGTEEEPVTKTVYVEYDPIHNSVNEIESPELEAFVLGDVDVASRWSMFDPYLGNTIIMTGNINQNGYHLYMLDKHNQWTIIDNVSQGHLSFTLDKMGRVWYFRYDSVAHHHFMNRYDPLSRESKVVFKAKPSWHVNAVLANPSGENSTSTG